MQRTTFPLRPRTNTLVTGPSGSGKTFLAKAVADEVGANFLGLAVTEWVLLGTSARGAASTWPALFKFLKNSKTAPGVVVFLDELDKIGGTSSAWESFLRNEVFRLLDLQIPQGLTNESNMVYGRDDYKDAQDTLQNRTFVIAAGAFQHVWEHRAKASMGFGDKHAEPPPDLATLAQSLPRELVNRFRKEMLILPALRNDDYHQMLAHMAAKVPSYLRKTFVRLGREGIPGAVQTQQGCRFLEELMLDTILHERALMRDCEIKKCSTKTGSAQSEVEKES